MGIFRVASHTSVRFATQWDLRQILKIDRLSFPKEWHYDTFRGALKDLVLVCEEKKILRTILGFLVARHSEGAESAMILKVAVHPHHRNKGVGTKLIEAALDELAKRNVRAVDLHVHLSNTGAMRLYERFGFTIVKIDRPDYGKDESYYLMRLNLGKPSN